MGLLVETFTFVIHDGLLLGILCVVVGLLFIIFLLLKRVKKITTPERFDKLSPSQEKSLSITAYEKRNILKGAMLIHLTSQMQSVLNEFSSSLDDTLSDTALPIQTTAQLQMISRRLLLFKELHAQLLTIYKEDGVDSSLTISSYEADKICNLVVHSFRQQLGTSNFPLIYSPSHEAITIWVDYKKIEFVLSCFFSHLLSSSNYLGQVEFSVKHTLFNEEPYCCFMMVVNGLEYNPMPTKELELVEDIIRSHHAILRLDNHSNDKWGYYLYIPMGKSHFEGESDIHFVPSFSLSDVYLFDDSLAVQEKEEPNDKPKIVVIEDNEHIYLYLKILLSKEFSIYLANNGEEGVRLVHEVKPDLILSDVMMPVMDGFECCRILKENLDTCHIPIILLTALNDDKDVVRGLELGADDYIIKPFKTEILQMKIRRVLNSRKELKSFYTRLLSNTSSSVTSNEVGYNHDPFIERLLEIIAANLVMADFSAKQLAEMVCMSQPTLYRKVKQITGLTIVELIRGVRLKESAILLKSKQYSIPEVAERVGYNDVPTFRKHFVELYGTTPSTFVKQHYPQNK